MTQPERKATLQLPEAPPSTAALPPHHLPRTHQRLPPQIPPRPRPAPLPTPSRSPPHRIHIHKAQPPLPHLMHTQIAPRPHDRRSSSSCVRACMPSVMSRNAHMSLCASHAKCPADVQRSGSGSLRIVCVNSAGCQGESALWTSKAYSLGCALVRGVGGASELGMLLRVE
ncbi:hypothetical protein DENSPDRAFT_64572 [Dentipellis sp. KUC8613]|nr:hypothetical protein DENSPDRAFT_64572 [Dentipellis sp. KUC8613]